MFIALEGIDGSGKTTAMQYISGYLNNRGIKHVCTNEPGGSALGKSVRKITKYTPSLHPIAQTYLMLAARIQHNYELINENLKAGYVVISDRYIDSTYAYQGGGYGVDLDIISRMEDSPFYEADCRILSEEERLALYRIPDHIIYFDVIPETALARISNKDCIEEEDVLFFRRVRKIYLQKANTALFNKDGRWSIVNAEVSINEVNFQLEKVLHKLFIEKSTQE